MKVLQPCTLVKTKLKNEDLGVSRPDRCSRSIPYAHDSRRVAVAAGHSRGRERERLGGARRKKRKLSPWDQNSVCLLL